jgi:large subunit ribosomal protein L17
MRHGKGFNHLGRTAPHRKAMMSNMASSLILNKKVQTTVAKAKALRPFVEKLITKSKSDSVHNRRTVFSYLQNKYSVQELFGPVADKIADRPGGYTRILKLGNRMGDNAEMCLMELVDFNEFIDTNSKAKKAGAKKSRRGSGVAKTKKTDTPTAEAEENSTPEGE